MVLGHQKTVLCKVCTFAHYVQKDILQNNDLTEAEVLQAKFRNVKLCLACTKVIELQAHFKATTNNAVATYNTDICEIRPALLLLF